MSWTLDIMTVCGYVRTKINPPIDSKCHRRIFLLKNHNTYVTINSFTWKLRPQSEWVTQFPAMSHTPLIKNYIKEFSLKFFMNMNFWKRTEKRCKKCNENLLWNMWLKRTLYMHFVLLEQALSTSKKNYRRNNQKIITD